MGLCRTWPDVRNVDSTSDATQPAPGRTMAPYDRCESHFRLRPHLGRRAALRRGDGRGLSARGHDVSILTYPARRFPAAVASAACRLETAIRSDAAPWSCCRSRSGCGGGPTMWCSRPGSGTSRPRRWRRSWPHAAPCHSPARVRRSHQEQHAVRWLYTRLADHVVVNSRATMETTRRSAPWLDERRMSLLYNGIDLRDYESPDPGKWRAELDPEGGHVVIGFVGQLVGRKRLDVVMRALTGPELGPLPWRLAIAGKGPTKRDSAARPFAWHRAPRGFLWLRRGHPSMAGRHGRVYPAVAHRRIRLRARRGRRGREADCVLSGQQHPEVVRDGETASSPDTATMRPSRPTCSGWLRTPH